MTCVPAGASASGADDTSGSETLRVHWSRPGPCVCHAPPSTSCPRPSRTYGIRARTGPTRRLRSPFPPGLHPAHVTSAMGSALHLPELFISAGRRGGARSAPCWTAAELQGRAPRTFRVPVDKVPGSRMAAPLDATYPWHSLCSMPFMTFRKPARRDRGLPPGAVRSRGFTVYVSCAYAIHVQDCAHMHTFAQRRITVPETSLWYTAPIARNSSDAICLLRCRRRIMPRTGHTLDLFRHLLYTPKTLRSVLCTC